MGRKIGAFLGDLVEVDTKMGGDCAGSCLRIHVCLDVSVPLWRWVMIDIGGDSETKLQLEYEDLPFFCFFCGRLTHFSSGCPLAREGIITEHHYGRRKTSSRNVFNIEPSEALKPPLRYSLEPPLRHSLVPPLMHSLGPLLALIRRSRIGV